MRTGDAREGGLARSAGWRACWARSRSGLGCLVQATDRRPRSARVGHRRVEPGLDLAVARIYAPGRAGVNSCAVHGWVFPAGAGLGDGHAIGTQSWPHGRSAWPVRGAGTCSTRSCSTPTGAPGTPPCAALRGVRARRPRPIRRAHRGVCR